MEFSNDGKSAYHNLQATYIRHNQGRPLRIIGIKAKEIQDTWYRVQPQLCTSMKDASPESMGRKSASNITARCLQGDYFSLNLSKVAVYEVQQPDKNHVVGFILATEPENALNTFQKFFMSLLLSQIRLQWSPETQEGEYEILPKDNFYTQNIIQIFDSYLRFAGPNDEWNDGGPNYFEERVRFYTKRAVKIEFCFPAFPCKSSNPNKVAGTMPDRGEEIALMRLHNFVRKIESVYPPGAKVWIISDGHVFSDCSESLPVNQVAVHKC
jgi:hypothetical protein